MGTAAKIVLGGIGLAAVWLVLAVTLLGGTGSVEPRPGHRTGTVTTVETVAGTADPGPGARP
jgi:hypothetical protein